MIELPNNIESLTELVKQLLEESERLKEENERLRAENAELRRRLGLDSHHSHKPPSSDGYRKKSVKPGIPKEGRTSKNGGQPGHKGKTLERVEHPDEIQIHLPKRCQCCQRPFTTEETYEIIPSRQVFDLPKPKLEVIEHRRRRQNASVVIKPIDLGCRQAEALRPIVLNPLYGIRVIPVSVSTARFVVGVCWIAVVIDGTQGLPRRDIGGTD